MDDDLSMFGELEEAPDDRMVVRAIGHALGTSEGWAHYAGLGVVFPRFRTTHPKLIGLITGIKADRLCLGIDFYTGEVKVIEEIKLHRQQIDAKVHYSLQLQELLA